MIRMNRYTLSCLIVTGALLAACGSDSEPEAAAAAPQAATPSAKPAPAPADPTVKMARAVGNGKPGAAVDIRYEFLAKPAIGTPTELEIALIPNAGVDSMEATVNGMEGITLAGPLTAAFPQVQAGKPYTHRVSVLPDRAGVFYISVTATTEIGGSSLSRTFSIPFVVGNPPAQQKAAPEKDAAGEAVEPMKAEETTSPTSR
jgi:hypothetical protein